MGVDGQGNREPGGSNQDNIFFMKYSLSFLTYWYTTFPLALQETTTTGTPVVSLSSVSVDPVLTGENSSWDTQSKLPHLPPRKTNLLWKCNVCEYHVLHEWDMSPKCLSLLSSQTRWVSEFEEVVWNNMLRPVVRVAREVMHHELELDLDEVGCWVRRSGLSLRKKPVCHTSRCWVSERSGKMNCT